MNYQILESEGKVNNHLKERNQNLIHLENQVKIKNIDIRMIVKIN